MQTLHKAANQETEGFLLGSGGDSSLIIMDSSKLFGFTRNLTESTCCLSSRTVWNSKIFPISIGSGTWLPSIFTSSSCVWKRRERWSVVTEQVKSWGTKSARSPNSVGDSGVVAADFVVTTWNGAPSVRTLIWLVKNSASILLWGAHFSQWRTGSTKAY